MSFQSGTAGAVVTKLVEMGWTLTQIDEAKEIIVTPVDGDVRYLSGTDPTGTFGHIMKENRTYQFPAARAADLRIVRRSTEAADVTIISDGDTTPETDPPPATTDVVRTAQGHPNAGTCDYTFSTAQDFTNTSSAEPGRAKTDNGGVLMSDGDSITITHTADADSQGFHTLKLGVDIPENGTLTILVEKNSTEVTTYRVAGGDGGANPQSATDYTVVLPEVNLGSGAVFDITLTYANTAPGGQSTQLLLDFATFTVTGSSTPSTTGTVIWSWTAGDISEATYDAFIDPSGPNFQTETNGAIQRVAGGAGHQALPTSPWTLTHQVNHEVPDIDSNGVLRAWGDENSVRNHCLVRPGMPSTPSIFKERWYFYSNVEYRAEFDLEWDTTYDWNSMNASGWAIPFQWHPGGFPSGHNQQAPINFYTQSQPLRFNVQLLANTNATPGSESWTHDNDFTFPFSVGKHRIDMEFRFDYTGTNSYFKLWMDRVKKVDTTVPIGLNHSVFGSGQQQMFNQFGIYQDGLNGTDQANIYHERYFLYHL